MALAGGKTTEGQGHAPAQTAHRIAEGVAIDTPLPADVWRSFIIVRDLGPSLAFWRNALGLDLNYDIEVIVVACEFSRGDAGNAGAAGAARLGIEHAQDFCGSHLGSFV